MLGVLARVVGIFIEALLECRFQALEQTSTLGHASASPLHLQKLAHELESERIASARTLQKLHLGRSEGLATIERLAGKALANGFLVDKRQVVFDLILIDNPDSPDLVELRHRDELELANMLGG